MKKKGKKSGGGHTGKIHVHNMPTPGHDALAHKSHKDANAHHDMGLGSVTSSGKKASAGGMGEPGGAGMEDNCCEYD